jgi:hypothetical protein
MADSPQNEVFDYPDPLVLDALFKRWAANKEQVAGLNGEVGDRLKTQYDLKKGFTPKGWQTYSSVRWIGLSNEAKARAEIRSIRRACDVAEAELDKNGHVGDIADMAEAAAKAEAEAKKVEAAEAETKAAATGNALPLDQAKKAFEANAHKAPTPAEVDAKAAKKGKRVTKKDKDSVDRFREELRGTIAEGDAHIKAVANDTGAVEPPRAARKAEPLEGPGHGTYKLQ